MQVRNRLEAAQRNMTAMENAITTAFEQYNTAQRLGDQEDMFRYQNEYNEAIERFNEQAPDCQNRIDYLKEEIIPAIKNFELSADDMDIIRRY